MELYTPVTMISLLYRLTFLIFNAMTSFRPWREVKENTPLPAVATGVAVVLFSNLLRAARERFDIYLEDENLLSCGADQPPCTLRGPPMAE